MVSSKARVQRKAQANAPTHVKRRMLSAHLSDELREKYGARAVRVCKDDTVVVVRGDSDIRGKEGKVISVCTKTGRVSIDGITNNQADQTEVARFIHASNIVIVKLNDSDAWRMESISKKKEAKK